MVAAVFLKIQNLLQRDPILSARVSSQDLNDRQLKLQEEFERRQKEQEEQRKERQENYVKQLTNQFIQTFSTSFQTKNHQRTGKKSSLLVDWVLKVDRLYFSAKQWLSLEMKVGEKRTYVVKKMKEFLKAIQMNRPYEFTKNFTYDPLIQEFNQEDLEIIQLLQKAIENEELYKDLQSHFSSNTNVSDQRALTLSPMISEDLLSKLHNSPIRFEAGKDTYDQINLYQDKLPLTLKLNMGPVEGFQFDLTSLLRYTYLDQYGYFILDNEFYKLSEEQRLLIKELKNLMDLSRSSILPIASDQIEPFISEVVPRIKKIGQVEIADPIMINIVNDPFKGKVYVDLKDERLFVSLEFHYGNTILHPFKPIKLEKGDPILMRDAEKERGIVSLIESASLKAKEDALYVEGEDEIYEFLYDALPLIEEKADIFLTQPVKALILPKNHSAVTTIDVDASTNWLTINFDIEGIDKEEIKSLLQSVVEKKKYYRLPSGAFVSLDSEDYLTIQRLFQEFKIKPSHLLQKDTIELPIYRGVQLDDLASNGTMPHAKYGKEFRKLINRLKNPEDLEFDLPKSLQAELRDYQKDGFQWLKTLKHYHLGGILADDMGLGKTLQSLAYLLSEKELNKDTKPSLIVAPASLIYN